MIVDVQNELCILDFSTQKYTSHASGTISGAVSHKV